MRITQPFDGELIADLETHTWSDVEEKLCRAADVFATRTNWLPAYRRTEILTRLALLLHRDREELAILIAREGGKPLTDASIEVTRAINGIEFAVAHLQHLGGTEIPMGLTPASADRWAFTIREPIGPVVAISAFNHPLNLIVHQVVPAIAAGCPVLIKPAPLTPLTCLRFIALVYEAGLPEAWCQPVILDDNTIAQRLATDSRVAYFSFIGSAKVGWHLRSLLAPGTRFTLEHGGAAPVIIDRSADLDAVVAPLIKGGYYHAGQVCVSVQRVFVHETLKEALIERLIARIAALNVGDPTLSSTDVGPLITPREVDRVDDWVSAAIAEGATLAVGGARLQDTMYQPTLLLEPKHTSRISTDEIFGPVMSIYSFTEINNAIDRANSLPFAFQAAIFTREIDAALHAARRLDASTVMINDHSAFRTDWMPFAGRRQSGFGIGGIANTMEDMAQHKMVVLKLPA